MAKKRGPGSIVMSRVRGRPGPANAVTKTTWRSSATVWYGQAALSCRGAGTNLLRVRPPKRGARWPKTQRQWSGGLGEPVGPVEDELSPEKVRLWPPPRRPCCPPRWVRSARTALMPPPRTLPPSKRRLLRRRRLVRRVCRSPVPTKTALQDADDPDRLSTSPSSSTARRLRL